MAAKSPFDEEFTPEEEAALKSDAVPPAEEEGEGNVEDAIREAEAGKTPAADAPKDPAAEESKPGEEKPAAQSTEEDEAKDLAAFLEKHKDKSPEELMKLAFQQQKRANKSEAQGRKVNEQIAQVAERVKAAQERVAKARASAPERKSQFREKLTNDPDAATAELHDALIDKELTEAETEAAAAKFDEAIVFAEAHIPEFGKQWPHMHTLAREFGYSDEELNGINDGRALVMLSLANHTARLMKAGIMDRFGNLDLSKIPQPEAATPTDPRLAVPEPQRTLGGQGARSARGAQTIEQQLAAIDAMSPAEFDAFVKENPNAIEDLLRKAA